jgi:hypothetical protein
MRMKQAYSFNSKPDESSKDINVFSSGGNGEMISVIVLAMMKLSHSTHCLLLLCSSNSEEHFSTTLAERGRRKMRNENYSSKVLLSSCAMLRHMKQPQQLELLF